MREVLDNVDLMWRGLRLTLYLSAIVMVAATFFGTFVGVGLIYGNRVLRAVLRAYVDIVRGTPLLVTIFLIFYGLPSLKIEMFGYTLNTNFGRFQTAAIAFSMFSTAHVGEIVRGALSSVPKGQTDAAKAIGLTFWKRLFYVLVPQAIPVMLPPWTNTAAEIVKGTSLVTLVGISDLLYEADKAAARTREFLPFYIAAAFTYFVICFAISRSGVLLTRRLRHGVTG